MTVGTLASVLFKELKKDEFSKETFIGVFPRDQLPYIKKYPCAFIINTQPITMKGEHWLAFYFDANQNGEFFDSYGNHPKIFGLEKYLLQNSRKWTYNSIRLQGDNSATCGQYSVYFILLKSRSFKLEEILRLFSVDNFKYTATSQSEHSSG